MRSARRYLGALQFLGPGNRYAYNPNYDNWAPRLGLSYQVVPKLVIHGGYGIFYPQAVTCCFPGDPDGFSADHVCQHQSEWRNQSQPEHQHQRSLG